MRYILALVLSCAVAVLSLAGCGASRAEKFRSAAIASETFATALVGLQEQFVAWGDLGPERGGVSSDVEKAWQRRFKAAAEIGLKVDDALRRGVEADVLAQAENALRLVDDIIATDVVRLSAAQRNIVGVAMQSLRAFVRIWQSIRAGSATARTLGDRDDLDAVAWLANQRLGVAPLTE